MKKITIILISALVLGFAPARADRRPGHGNGHGPRTERPEYRLNHRPDHKPGPPHRSHPAPPPPRPHYSRPAPPPPPPPAYGYYARPAGISVSLGPVQLVMTNAGVYYREVCPGSYAVERPPLGLIVPRIPHGRRVYHRGYYCHLVQGVLYLPIGNGFKVIGYM